MSTTKKDSVVQARIGDIQTFKNCIRGRTRSDMAEGGLWVHRDYKHGKNSSQIINRRISNFTNQKECSRLLPELKTGASKIPCQINPVKRGTKTHKTKRTIIAAGGTFATVTPHSRGDLHGLQGGQVDSRVPNHMLKPCIHQANSDH